MVEGEKFVEKTIEDPVRLLLCYYIRELKGRTDGRVDIANDILQALGFRGRRAVEATYIKGDTVETAGIKTRFYLMFVKAIPDASTCSRVVWESYRIPLPKARRA